MPRLAFLLAAFALTTTAAVAAKNWNGAGWYRTEESLDGGMLLAGPFAQESDCLATVPSQPPDDGAYYCRFFTTDPIEYD
jgi:hypothetical protein